MKPTPHQTTPQPPVRADEHVRDEDESLTIKLGELTFKALFRFFGVAATLLSAFANLRRQRS